MTGYKKDSNKVTTLCRDCFHLFENKTANLRCEKCRSANVITHNELTTLGIAHLDCDAFFAMIEKRDNPELRDKPVIVGGGGRGVVSTCCYIARKYGVHSAQPMFRARALCPQAVVIRPNIEKYALVGRQIRALMAELTPLVQPLSIDEAFMDLRGTERLHHAIGAQSLAQLALRIEQECGITVSIGLSYNKFLAKLASDLDKPRGFAVIGENEAATFLAQLPVSAIWGIGKSMQKKLAHDGITHIHHLQALDKRDLTKRYGQIGLRIAQLAHGEDARLVHDTSPVKSVSSETTFEKDISALQDLEYYLWRMAERTAERCRAKGVAGRVVVLKLKNNHFKSITRNRTLPDPTQLADVMYMVGRDMLHAARHKGEAYRLIGIGVAGLCDSADADPIDLADPSKQKRKAAEESIHHLRQKYGRATISKGRGIKNER